MRQQEGIGNDDAKLNRSHHKEGYGRDDKEDGDDHQEKHD